MIYIIHENILLRIYYRPMLWEFVFENFGDKHLVFWTFVLDIIVFLFGFFCAVIYKYTVQKAVKPICDRIYRLISIIWKRLEKTVLEFNKS